MRTYLQTKLCTSSLLVEVKTSKAPKSIQTRLKYGKTNYERKSRDANKVTANSISQLANTIRFPPIMQRVISSVNWCNILKERF